MSKEREEFVALMAAEGVPLDVSRAVMRHAKTMFRLAEKECNEGLTPMDKVRDRRCEERITELLKPFRCHPIFSGDPRGPVVKIQVPSGGTNDWGHEGICVP